MRVLVLAVSISTILGVGLLASGQRRAKVVRPFQAVEYKHPVPTPMELAPEPSDPQERQLRELKSRRYNGRGITPLPQLAEGVSPLPLILHQPVLPTLPVAESDAVLLGEVIRVQPYFSSDKTSIYSEFTVRVEEIVRNDKLGHLKTGRLATIEREGGCLRLPNGRTLLHRIEKQNLPFSGKRYVFFLKLREKADYIIVFAYELLEGAVFPLDDAANRPGAPEYWGTDENSFLNDLRAKIHQTREKQ